MKLVTGCAGFIGSHLTEKLLNRGLKVIGIDNFDDYYSPEIKRRNIKNFSENKNFRFIEADIRKVKSIPENVDTVFHLAAICGVRNSIKNPTKYVKVNIGGTANLLELSLNKVSQFIFASSSSVYGDKPLDKLPAKETDALNPISPYALSKLQAEELCKLFSKIYGLPVTILRYFTVYGPRQRPDEAICKFTKLLLNGKRPCIYGNGEQTRDFTHVNDIVQGTLMTDDSKSIGIFNLGSSDRISVNELVKLLKDEIETNIEPEYVDKKMGDVRHTWADISKAREAFGYKPGVEIKEGIQNFVRWFKRENVDF